MIVQNYNFMTKRVTVLLPDNIDKKIRLKQSKLITQTMKYVSFSSVLNDVLTGKLKL